MDENFAKADVLRQSILKKADEYSKQPYKRNLRIPIEYTWEKIYPLSGALNKISEAAKLKRIVNMIGDGRVPAS